MIVRKNTLQSAATLKRVEHDYTVSGGKEQDMVYESLGVGEENSLSPEYLKNSLGFSSIRALQKQIEYERRQGKVILSSTQPPGGYYLPKDALEVRRFVRTLENRGKKTLAALKGARQLLADMEGE